MIGTLVGWVSGEYQVRTVGDLRAMVRELDGWGVPDSREAEAGTLSRLFVNLSSDDGDTVEVEPIECGDHVPGTARGPVDFLIVTHGHGDAG